MRRGRRGTRRGGGSASRRASRAIDTPSLAVWPGLSGGQYRPLTDADIARIYDAALDILENIGIGEPIPEILNYALAGGCTLDDDGRLRFPRALVEDLIDVSAKRYTLFAPDAEHDLEVGG